MRALFLPALLILAGCAGTGSTKGTRDSGSVGGTAEPTAWVRHEAGWLGAPFPDDALLRADRTAELAGFPTVESSVLGPVIAGWAWRISQASHGFGANAPVYFPLDGTVALPTQTEGHPEDPVLLIDLDTGELHGLELRFVADPGDDPYLVPGLLQVVARPGHTPRSGARLAAVLMETSGVAAEAVPTEVEVALAGAGVTGGAAAATVFTVQDTTAELQALAADLDARMGARGWPELALREAVSLEYAPTETETGASAIALTTRFSDGTEERCYLDGDLESAFSVDLLDWPMAVYQTEIPLYNYSGLDSRPYMSPGIGHLGDTRRDDGWIRFDGEGRLLTVPDEETVRVVVQVPREPVETMPLMVWDHGTNGSAWNIVQRRKPEDQGRAIAEVFAEAGVVVVSHDQPLWAARFPLHDSGFTDGWLGFYNIVNLTAMRDNHRQAGIEGHQLKAFATEALPGLLPGVSIDTETVLRGGHSLGGSTGNNGLVSDPDGWDGAFLSGAAGLMALSFLETGLAESGGTGFVGDLADIFGADLDEDADIGVILAIALGIEDGEAQQRFDRLHPAVGLFQWIMDPADPTSFGRDETMPVTLLVGEGDLQVPNAGTEALDGVLPESDLVLCGGIVGYDPHSCLFRDGQGVEALAGFLGGY
jgi:hypothetical protein